VPGFGCQIRGAGQQCLDRRSNKQHNQRGVRCSERRRAAVSGRIALAGSQALRRIFCVATDFFFHIIAGCYLTVLS